MIDPVKSFEMKFDIFELLDRMKCKFQSMILYFLYRINLRPFSFKLNYNEIKELDHSCKSPS